MAGVPRGRPWLPASLGRKRPVLSANSPISVPCPSPGLFLPRLRNSVESVRTKGVSVRTLGYTGLRQRQEGGSPMGGCSLRPGLGGSGTRTKRARCGLHVTLIRLLVCARCQRCSGGWGTHPYMKWRDEHILGVGVCGEGLGTCVRSDRFTSWFLWQTPGAALRNPGRRV